MPVYQLQQSSIKISNKKAHSIFLCATCLVRESNSYGFPPGFESGVSTNSTNQAKILKYAWRDLNPHIIKIIELKSIAPANYATRTYHTKHQFSYEWDLMSFLLYGNPYCLHHFDTHFPETLNKFPIYSNE